MNEVIESMQDENGNVHTTNSELLDALMTVIEDRATRTYSEFIG